jgi:3'-phosphoadenosine 5'-phosphosulfate sulfotransferase (PAPS reductase)/FAD synthetase
LLIMILVQSMSQQILKQELTVSQILHEYGKHFTQIREQYSDGHNGRCAMGVIMSYYGWGGKDSPGAERKLLAALIALRHAGISKDLVIQLNDTGMTFDEIADFLDNEAMSWQQQELHNVLITCHDDSPSY